MLFKKTAAKKPLVAVCGNIFFSQIVQKFAFSLLLKVFSTGFSFLITVLLARQLGAEGYGIYAFATAVMLLVSIPVQAGLPELVVRETAKGVALGELGKVLGVWRWSGSIALLFSLALVLLVIPILFLLQGNLSVQLFWSLLFAVILASLMALCNLVGSAVRGLNRVIAGLTPELLIRPGILFFTLAGLAHLTGMQLTPAIAMAVHVSAALLALLFAVWFLLRIMPATVRGSHADIHGKLWLRSIFPLAIIGAMQAVNLRTDVFIMGLFWPSDQVGIYHVALQVATFSSFGLQAVNMSLSPRFAELFAKKDILGLQWLVSVSAKAVFLFCSFIVVIFTLFGVTLLELFFGQEFVLSYVPLLLLFGGQLVSSAVGSVGFLLIMTGNERVVAKAFTVGALTNIALNVLLIPRFGTVGAAVATSASVATWSILLWSAAKTTLGIDSIAFKSIKKLG